MAVLDGTQVVTVRMPNTIHIPTVVPDVFLDRGIHSRLPVVPAVRRPINDSFLSSVGHHFDIRVRFLPFGVRTRTPIRIHAQDQLASACHVRPHHVIYQPFMRRRLAIQLIRIKRHPRCQVLRTSGNDT